MNMSKVIVAGCILGAATMSHAAVRNLLQDTAVRTAGTYTYYARGDDNANAITPLTKSFFPGPSLHSVGAGDTDKDKISATGFATDDGTNGAPIGISYGLLTDDSISTRVSGWINIEQNISGSASGTHYGTFNILVDLGTTYKISSVGFSYTDSSGRRFDSATGRQIAYYSNSTDTLTESSFTQLNTGTITSSTTSTLNFADSQGNTVDARYILFQISVQVGPNPTSGSVGGYLNEIYVNGDAVPEASALSLLGFGAGSFLIRRR